jgi:hypothetical protein
VRLGWWVKRPREIGIGIIRRRFVIMKSILIAVLMGGVVLSVVSSCATVPTGPLAPGEVRLLSIDVRRNEPITRNISYLVDIIFEAKGEPQIKRACFYWSGDGPHCFEVTNVSFGLQRAFQLYLPGLGSGLYRLECYAQYIRDGETRKTNVVSTQIAVGR